MVAYDINKKTLTITLKYHHQQRRRAATANSVLSTIAKFLLLTVLSNLIPLIIKTTKILGKTKADGQTLETKEREHRGNGRSDPEVVIAKAIKIKNRSKRYIRNKNIKALPPLTSPETKTVFLDLDETLIHSQQDTPPKRFDFMVSPIIDGVRTNFYVMKRPGVDAFLEAVSKKNEVVVFTAGRKEYAEPIIDKLDKNGVISHRLYRDSCKKYWGIYVKDLSEVGRDLKRAVLVDDNPKSYLFQPRNAIPVRPFRGGRGEGDMELKKLVEFFEFCDKGDYYDMRDAVKEYNHLRSSLGDKV